MGLKKVVPIRGVGGAGMGTRTASLDVLNERGGERDGEGGGGEVLDYNYRRMRHPVFSSSQLTQSCDHFSDVPPIMLQNRSKTSSVQVSKAVSRSPKLFRKKVWQWVWFVKGVVYIRVHMYMYNCTLYLKVTIVYRYSTNFCVFLRVMDKCKILYQ